jgi:UTP:GlnB (protein PII) uridylyltransferase
MGGEVVSGTRTQDKLGIAVSKLVDYADEINQLISEYKEKKQAISATIRKIENADQIKVLHKLYFEHKPWKIIAQEMHMTERNAQYIHGDALRSFNRVLRGEQYES